MNRAWRARPVIGNIKKHLICLIFIMAVSGVAIAQTPDSRGGRPADVVSADSILNALYDVISGEAGKQRDWDRFRHLFHKEARLIATFNTRQDGLYGTVFMSTEDYIKRTNDSFLRDGFVESEIHRHIDVFGNIAQVFTTYEARRKKDDPKPFVRGINSIQLFNDGKRWWILNVYWQAEEGEVKIPAEYLKKK